MGLRAGDLRQQVVIRSPNLAQNESGGYDTAWQDIATVWAQVLGVNGRESMIGQAFQGVSYFKITIRWRGDVTDTMQLGYGSLDLNIRSATDPDGRLEQLLILADTGSAQKTS